MKKNLMVLSGLALGLLPVVASADAVSCDTSGSFLYVLCQIGNLISTAIPIVITLAVLYFIWGVIKYVISQDEEAKKGAKDMIIYGIIGLALIVGMWGFVKLLTNSLGLDKTASPTSVQIPGYDGAPKK